MDVKVDDKVLYAKYAGTTIKLDGKELLILKESDILAIVEYGLSSSDERRIVENSEEKRYHGKANHL